MVHHIFVGYVEKAFDNEFSAIIEDNENNEEWVTISYDKIHKDDIPLVKSGAVFYWTIQLENRNNKGFKTESRIRFRRVAKWTKTEIERAKREGNELAKIFE